MDKSEDRKDHKTLLNLKLRSSENFDEKQLSMVWQILY